MSEDKSDYSSGWSKFLHFHYHDLLYVQDGLTTNYCFQFINVQAATDVCSLIIDYDGADTIAMKQVFHEHYAGKSLPFENLNLGNDTPDSAD